MSKVKYLLFTDNLMPRVLINPSDELLASVDPTQLVRYNKAKHLKGVPLHRMALDHNEIRRTSYSEQGKVDNLLESREEIPLQFKGVKVMGKAVEIDVQSGMDRLYFAIGEILKDNQEEMRRLRNRNAAYTMAIMITIILTNLLK